jgi:phage shock protein PspC (stress-responsive transcriptional regulator)
MAETLYRSRLNTKIAGVCGGLAEYFKIDPTLIRIIAILLVFANGAGLIAYIIAWIVMPKRPLGDETEVPNTPTYSRWNAILPGVIILAIGLFFLAHNFWWWWFDWHDFWPFILVVVGILIIVKALNRPSEEEKPTSGEENQ